MAGYKWKPPIAREGDDALERAKKKLDRMPNTSEMTLILFAWIVGVPLLVFSAWAIFLL